MLLLNKTTIHLKQIFRLFIYSVLTLIYEFNMYGLNIKPLEVKKGKDGFELIGNEHTKIKFKNTVSIEAASNNQILLNGSGVTASDYDNDGYVDLFFSGLESDNKLYRNMGNFVFSDITPESLKCKNIYCTTSISADVNGDNWQDIVVGTIGKGVLFYINDQKGGFTQLSYANTTQTDSAIYGIAITDLDNDNDLDLYVSTYRSDSIRNNKNIKFTFENVNGINKIRGAVDVLNRTKYSYERFYMNDKGNIFESGPSDYIIINENNKKYINVTTSKYFYNINKDFDINKNWGLGCIFADLNNDFKDDLYVCNDLEGGDFIFMYDNGTYRNGRNLVKNNSPMFSMGVDVADINNDGQSDIFICDMLNHSLIGRKNQTLRYPYINYSLKKPFLSYENNRNMLFIGHNNKYFDEVAYYAGLESSNWSWCPIFIDVDLDGYQDLFVTNGFGYDLENIDIEQGSSQGESYNSGYLAQFSKENFESKYVKNEINLSFRNNGNLTFTNKEKDWGLDFNGISHGACLADLDNDGDEDIIINNYSLYSTRGHSSSEYNINYSNPNALIYKNLSDKKRIRIKISNYPGNTKGIGATVKLIQNDIIQTKQIRAGARYCSSDELAVTFSFNKNITSSKLELFLNNKKATHNNVKSNFSYTFSANDFKFVSSTINRKKSEYQLFDVINNSSIEHYPFDTPSSTIDIKNLNKDVYLNEPVMSIFTPHRSQDSIILYNGSNTVEISGNKQTKIEKNTTSGRLYDFFTLKHKNVDYLFELRNKVIEANQVYSKIVFKEYQPITKQFIVKKSFTVLGFYKCFNWKPSAKTETIDLILGGGPELNNYPRGHDTILIPFDLNKEKFNNKESIIISRQLLVNDIHIVGPNEDNTFDIILAPEASNIQWLRTDKANKILDITERMKLGKLAGFWNSITSGDINADGKLDFLFGNASLNTKYNKYIKEGYSLLFDARKRKSIFHESFKWESKKYLMQNLNEFKRTNPLLGSNYSSNTEFSQSTIETIFNNKMSELNINKLGNIILMSNENGYSIEDFDKKLNFLPIYGSSINDFNLDGKMDIYVCQGYPAYKNDVEPSFNFSGLFLMSDRRGKFVSYRGEELGMSGDMFSPRCILNQDLNLDNKPDIIIGDYGKKYIAYKNNSKNKALKVNIRGNDIDIYGAKIHIKYESGDTGPLLVYTPRKAYRTSIKPEFYLGSRKEHQVAGINIQLKNKKYYIPVKKNLFNYSLEANSF